MGYEPIARRTRGKKAEEFNKILEMNRRAKKIARKEWKKQTKDYSIVEDGDDDGFMRIDEDEYQRRVGFKSSKSEDKSKNEFVSCFDEGENSDEEKNQVGVGKSDDFGKFDEGEDSDESCKILGQGFCPWTNDIDDDDDDDDDDVGESSKQKKDDIVTADQGVSKSQESSDLSSSSSSDDDDKEYRVDQLGSSSSSECLSFDASSDEEIKEDYLTTHPPSPPHHHDHHDHGHGHGHDNQGHDVQKNNTQKTKTGRKRSREENNPEKVSIFDRKAKQVKFSSQVQITHISYSDDDDDDDGDLDDGDDHHHHGVAKPSGDPTPPTQVHNEVELVLPPLKDQKKKTKRVRDKELQNILYNTLNENGGVTLEDKVTPDVKEETLPLKFKFGREEIITPPKTEEELEVDSLFGLLDHALLSQHIGEDKICRNHHNDEDFIPSQNGVHPETHCRQGEHYFIYDEEVGIFCKFCAFIKVEIRHCTPEFNSNPFGNRESRARRKSYNDGDNGYSDDPLDGSDYGKFGHESSSENNIKGTVWDLIPRARSSLYPHQRDGFEFIWRNVAGGTRIDELGKPTKDGLGGCIICHAPGTGKTRLASVFLHSYMKQYPNSHPVIIGPTCVLPAWEEEFNSWKTGLAFFNLNNTTDTLPGSHHDGLGGLPGGLRNVKDSKSLRLAKLCSWKKERGVLGLSYSLFEKMTGDHRLREHLLTKPGIMVLDEGHTPRNETSRIWKALSSVATRKKIILSGTPFQNNFQELYNVIALARDGFVDPFLVSSSHHRDYSSRNKYGGANKALLDSKKIEDLKVRIKPFVHVYKGDILRQTLPGLVDCVLVLKPSELQRRCLGLLRKLKYSFELDHWTSVASVHPSLLLKAKQTPGFLDQELKELLEMSEKDIDAGVKTRFSYELIKLCRDEKVLVFSQHINPLEHLKELLQDRLKWELEREILYMDGKGDGKQRQTLIKKFNSPKSQARVLLASTRACCEGIHLVGASRVILLDVVWNPSVERQAISRAYRLGQEKNVHVYHLISGQQEYEKYFTMLSKDRVSEMVFSASEEGKSLQNPTGVASKDLILEEMINHEKTKLMFEKILCQPKADDLIESFGY